MKRITRTIVLAVTLVIAFSGFKPVENKSINIVDCQLTADEANFKLLPGSLYRHGAVSLRVTVANGQNRAADGFKKVELLQIPVSGISFRVPLSKKLVSNQSYRVTVAVDYKNSEAGLMQWPALTVKGTSSNDFFSRKFKAITEPASLRNQVSAASIRSNIN